jgi:hypothetical protein
VGLVDIAFPFFFHESFIIIELTPSALRENTN